MVFTWAFFASSHFLNAYYLAALVPPLGALCGLGVSLAWRTASGDPQCASSSMATVLVGRGLCGLPGPDRRRASPADPRPAPRARPGRGRDDARSLPGASRRRPARGPRPGPGLPPGLRLLRRRAAPRRRPGPRLPRWRSGLGPFDSPYQPAAQTAAEHAGWKPRSPPGPTLAAQAAPCPLGRSIETAETSAQVSEDILATGHEYLPVGGFTGQVPATSVRPARG